MNKRIFKQLCMNYNKDADKDLYELWEYNLRCYNEDEMQKAVSFIIANDRYFPTLSRVLEVVKEIVSKDNIILDDEYKKEKMIQCGVISKWLNKDITKQEVDEKTKEEFKDFNKFIQEFRDSNNKVDDMNNFIEELRNEIC